MTWIRLAGMVVLFGAVQAAADDAARREAYIEAVTQGAGLMPWQDPGVSPEEAAFRARIEQRKDAMIEARNGSGDGALVSLAPIESARLRLETDEAFRAWFERERAFADDLLARPDDFIEVMIPELTPWHTYGFTCPNCVGKQSQEGAGTRILGWSLDNPDQVFCRECGQTYPDPKYPETATLQCPRTGQSFTFYLNDAQRANPDDRSGDLAWTWVGYPMHMSFTGMVRMSKIQFMIRAAERVAVVHALSGDPQYAAFAGRVLERLATCYRNWLYHDYWDGIADCDPMYAAWHDRSLPLEWKRHLTERAFAKDTLDKAAMMQTYWGAGRIHPSTDSISALPGVVLAYELVRDALEPAARGHIERDLILEWLMGAEPYVGGEGRADETNNKAPRIYSAMAAVGRSLDLPVYADLALQGYEGVRDASFLPDGFSVESPAYTNMYLSQLLAVPETLQGYVWPDHYAARTGKVDTYATDDLLRLMLWSIADQLRPDGRYLPLADTNQFTKPSSFILETGARRYPDYVAPVVGALFPGLSGPVSNVFDTPLVLPEPGPADLPERYFPYWMTAILRHGAGPEGAVLSLTFSPPGGHRHRDNLALFYETAGHGLLGDLGYVGDMPVNAWIRSTASHNLVVVDGEDQQFSGDSARKPALHFLVQSPYVSALEASSKAYPQCETYRRTVVLLKGPDGRTAAVDIFRVRGGAEHRYRVFSELASSDAPAAALEFEGVAVPEEPPLPKVAASIAHDDIFGIRDTRGTDGPPAAWRAVWREEGAAYRLWMASPVDRIEAGNGPGQEDHRAPGRRVRVVDAVRRGAPAESVFVAVHEPILDGQPVVMAVERLDVSEPAVALRVETAWGTYTVLSGCREETELGGLTFQGELGVHFDGPGSDGWLLGLGSEAFQVDGHGYTGDVPTWAGNADRVDGYRLEASTPAPASWAPAPAGFQNHVLVDDGTFATGFPVAQWDGRTISLERFPAARGGTFELPNLRFMEY